MKKSLIATVLALASMNASADVGAFAGISYAFGPGSGIGFTIQATSSRNEDHAIAAAGVSFYPMAPGSKFGIPVGVGYQGNHVAGIVSYDILQKAFAVSGGYVNTDSNKHHAPPPPPPPPITPPID